MQSILFSLSLRDFAWQHAWYFPLVESLHYIGHFLLWGGIFMFDLRLLGICDRVPIDAFKRVALYPAAAGFMLATISGSLLLLGNIEHLWGNPALNLKAGLIAAAGINIGIFHCWIDTHHADWQAAKSPPFGVKLSGLISILLWFGVICCGRLIAYF